VQTKDDGFLVGGRTNSGLMYDKSAANFDPQGYTDDYWVVKLNAPVVTNMSNEGLDQNSLVLYPNPANVEKGFWVSLEGLEAGKVSLTMFDSVGEKVEVTLEDNGMSTLVNTSSLRKGMYTLVMKSGTSKSVRKVVLL